MQKSALQALLEKASQGDVPSLQKLTKKLCDRLVFIPIVESKNQGNDTVKVSVIRVREGDRKIIPAFLSQQTLKRWLDLTELSGEGMAMYCSDICKALGAGHWLMIDAGTEYWVELDPKYADEIGAYEPIEEDDEFLEPEQWSMRETVAQKVESKPISQQTVTQQPPTNPVLQALQQGVQAPLQQPMQINATQEVPIVPHPMTVKHNLNPSEKVAQFPGLGKMGADGAAPQPNDRSSGLKRFRQEDDDDGDIRSTMDLTALRNRKNY